MKNFIAAAFLVTSIFATAQTPGTTSPAGVPATGSESVDKPSEDLQTVDHADGALVNPSFKKQKMEELDNGKVRDVKSKEIKNRKKIDSSSNIIDHVD